MIDRSAPAGRAGNLVFSTSRGMARQGLPGVGVGMMMFRVAVWAMAAVAASFASAQAPGLATMPATSRIEYRLAMNDTLKFDIFGEEKGKFARELIVNDRGMLNVPLIGEIAAAGQTVEQVRQAIIARLRDGYFVDPKVELSIADYRPYFVLGEVNKPGKFTFAPGLTVTSAIAEAGGFTYRAKTHVIYIQRQGQETKVRLDPGTQIQPGDTIRVGERHF
jgi:polysaccharide export outer membrane protein